MSSEDDFEGKQFTHNPKLPNKKRKVASQESSSEDDERESSKRKAPFLRSPNKEGGHEDRDHEADDSVSPEEEDIRLESPESYLLEKKDIPATLYVRCFGRRPTNCQ
jgi:hypothetical protein